MPTTFTITRQVQVAVRPTCATCGEALDVSIPREAAYVEVQVEPCPTCMDRTLNEGRAQGRALAAGKGK